MPGKRNALSEVRPFPVSKTYCSCVQPAFVLIFGDLINQINSGLDTDYYSMIIGWLAVSVKQRSLSEARRGD